MGHEVESPPEATTVDSLYGAVLHDEHQLLHAASEVDDLYRWRDWLVAELTRPESSYARAMAAISSTMTRAQDAMSYAVFLDRWARIVAETIQRLQHLGAIARQRRPEDLATAILAAIHGGVLLARVTDDVRVLRNALRLPFEQLLPPTGENGSVADRTSW